MVVFSLLHMFPSYAAKTRLFLPFHVAVFYLDSGELILQVAAAPASRSVRGGIADEICLAKIYLTVP